MTFLSQEDHINAVNGIHPERLRSCGREGFTAQIRVVDEHGPRRPPGREDGRADRRPRRAEHDRLPQPARAHRADHPRRVDVDRRHGDLGRGPLRLHRRPRQGHDHLRRREHLLGAGRGGHQPAPGRAGVRRLRRPRRRVGRDGQGRRRAQARADGQRAGDHRRGQEAPGELPEAALGRLRRRAAQGPHGEDPQARTCATRTGPSGTGASEWGSPRPTSRVRWAGPSRAGRTPSHPWRAWLLADTVLAAAAVRCARAASRWPTRCSPGWRPPGPWASPGTSCSPGSAPPPPTARCSASTRRRCTGRCGSGASYRVSGGIVSAAAQGRAGAPAPSTSSATRWTCTTPATTARRDLLELHRLPPEGRMTAAVEVGTELPALRGPLGQRREDEDDGGAAVRPHRDPLGRRDAAGPRHGRPADQPGPAQHGLRHERRDRLGRRPRPAAPAAGPLPRQRARRAPPAGARHGHRAARGGRRPAGRLRRGARGGRRGDGRGSPWSRGRRRWCSRERASRCASSSPTATATPSASPTSPSTTRGWSGPTAPGCTPTGCARASSSSSTGS